MEPGHFASLSSEVEENVSGTSAEPILVAVLPGKRGKGAMFIIKIEELYYEMYKHSGGKNHWNIRCSKWNAEKFSYIVRIVTKANFIRPWFF